MPVSKTIASTFSKEHGDLLDALTSVENCVETYLTGDDDEDYDSLVVALLAVGSLATTANELYDKLRVRTKALEEKL